jgi:hypothetical protein
MWASVIGQDPDVEPLLETPTFVLIFEVVVSYREYRKLNYILRYLYTGA